MNPDAFSALDFVKPGSERPSWGLTKSYECPDPLSPLLASTQPRRLIRTDDTDGLPSSASSWAQSPRSPAGAERDKQASAVASPAPSLWGLSTEGGSLPTRLFPFGGSCDQPPEPLWVRVGGSPTVARAEPLRSPVVPVDFSSLRKQSVVSLLSCVMCARHLCYDGPDATRL